MPILRRFVLLVLFLFGFAGSPVAGHSPAYAGGLPQGRVEAESRFEVAQSNLPNWAAGLTGAKKDSANTGSGGGNAQSGGKGGGAANSSEPAAASSGGGGQAQGQGGAAAGSSGQPAETQAPQPLPAQLETVLQPVRRLISLLEDYEKTVERVQDRDDDLARLRGEIDKLPGEARAAIANIMPRLDEIRAQIDKLGPPPKSDEPAEAAEVAGERARLNGLLSQLDGAIKSAELGDVKARQLIGRVQDLRQSIFAQQVLARTKHSPLSPSIWKSVAGELPNAAGEIASIGRGWWHRATSRLIELTAIVVLTLVVFFGLRLLRRKIVAARLGQSDGREEPSFSERAAVATWVAPALILPGAAATLFLYVGLESNDLLFLQTTRLATVIVHAVLVGLVVSGLSRAILQPTRGAWRLLDLADAPARRLDMLLRLAAIFYGIDLVLGDVIKMLYLPFQVSVAQAFVFSMIFAGLLFALARTPLTRRFAAAAAEGGSESAAAGPLRWREWFKLPVGLTAVLIAGAALAGYVALARYMSYQVLLTGTAIVVIIMMHLGIRAISSAPSEETASVSSRMLADRLRLGAEQHKQVDRILYGTLNALLAVVAVLMLLYTWGFSVPEITALVKSAVFGFDVGGIHIAPTRILLAIGLFVALLFATRLIQRWLKGTVLQPSRIDSGLANSIHTGIGYAGFALAALAAVSYGGLDITNLAIVAGALSVGIGFGLQSIVNNFVSGLILLVERPIKVGDWISVGAYEGHVRRISVRSTEIETFDRSSVIVPNSELISGTVKNRTHRNALGRVDVLVGVSYSSDPELVKELLEKVAQDSPMVLKFPAPIVSFDNFAASSLDFTVRAYVADVNKSVATATDLRLRIFKMFAEKGIEIPFPQQDVHLRDLDFVKATVARMAAERMAKAAGGTATSEATDNESETKPAAGQLPRTVRTS